MKCLFRCVAGAAAMLAASASLPGIAAAADAEPAPLEQASPFTGSLSIYGWLPWYNGKAAVNGLPSVDFSGDPSDILDQLKFVMMASGDVRWNKFGLFGDFIYLNLDNKKATPGPLFGSAKLDMETFIVTTALTYQLYENDTSWIQGVAGARFWSLDTTVSLGAGILPAASAGDTINWVDPVVGLRGRHELSEKMFLTGTALIGGFGAGSKFMWDVFGGIGYRFTPNFATTAGFRALGVDYHHGGDVVDMVTYGPLIAFTLVF